MKPRSFLISKLFLASLLSLSIVGCVSSPKEEITVYYGAMSVSTPIRENGTFKHQETVKSTFFSLSGKVENLKGNYLTHIELSIKNKSQESTNTNTRELKTQLLLTKNERISIGGMRSQDTFIINGEKTVKTTEENIYLEIK